MSRPSLVRIAAIAAALTAACSSSNSEDGGETHWLGCEAGTRCDAGARRDPVQVDRKDGEATEGSSRACGDGTIDRGEDCDGTNLGGETCASATMNTRPTGKVTCSECRLVLTECSSPGEDGSAPPDSSTGGTDPGGGGRDSGTGGARSAEGTGVTTGTGGGPESVVTDR